MLCKNECGSKADAYLVVYVPYLGKLTGVWFTRGPFCKTCFEIAVHLLRGIDTLESLRKQAKKNGVRTTLDFWNIEYEAHCCRHTTELEALRRSKLRRGAKFN